MMRRQRLRLRGDVGHEAADPEEDEHARPRVLQRVASLT